jgi:cytochrome P450
VAKPRTTILGEHIPVGTKVATSIWGTHHSESIWGPDADQFKPERFLRQAENGKLKFDPHGGLKGEAATYSFLPFGAGVRSCIGERFARGEFAILLAVLVGKFDWTLTNPKAKLGDDVVLNFGLVTKPQGGLSLMARKIEGW